MTVYQNIFSDIKNCENDDGCHDNATCSDDNGSYTCVCNIGFTGDGFNCTGNKLIHDSMTCLFIEVNGEQCWLQILFFVDFCRTF